MATHGKPVLMTPDEAFGEMLRALRAERKLSQERLALESGHDRSYISLLERGRNSPTLDTIFRLAKVLAIKPSEMIARMETDVQSIPERPRR